ncbi:hypothetical protein DL96DRAFT_1042389 [Flagelloscypha sp. PMI_526]|nr:hypothetical protein DL96DRAFT_1042389 [Flagelloscypha sp. PMI_526]
MSPQAEMSFMANPRPSSSVNVEEVTANIKRLMQQDVDNITQRLRHEHEQQIATLKAELAKERISVSNLQQTTKEVEEEREKAEAERDKTQRNGLSIAYYLDKELYQILRSIIPTYDQPAAPSFQSASIHDRFDRLTAHVDTLNKHIGPECSCNDDIRAAIEARNRVELGNGNQTQVSDRESQSAANASISSAYETVRVERDSLKSANQHLIGQRDNATAGLESATTKLQAAELKIRELEQNLLDTRTAVSSEACTAFQASQRQVVRLEEAASGSFEQLHTLNTTA